MRHGTCRGLILLQTPTTTVDECLCAVPQNSAAGASGGGGVYLGGGLTPGGMLG